MDFDQNNDHERPSHSPYDQGTSTPPPSQPVYGPSQYHPPQPPRRRISAWRIIWGVLFGLSVLANIGLFLLLAGMVAFVATGQVRLYEEVIVREGPRDNKIVLVNLTGMIHGEQAENVYRQLKAAREDRNVKGLIVRVNSPGGTISGSDRIYQEIRRYRQEMGKPVIAFMQGVAASGGYYASVACEQIVAEPTALTGSIGVIMSHFVFEELLENKLGIKPVFMTEGEKKDWPRSFREPEQPELDYIRERLLRPAYNRFVDIVKEGRKKALTPDRVSELADGSIYVAPKALEVKLIDKIGYLDDAVDAVTALAGITKAQVVEYRRPFSWMGFLGAKSANVFKLDRMRLYELSTPDILYLWHAGTQ